MRWIFAIFSISFLWSGIATQAFGQDDSGDSQVNWSAPPRRHQPNPDVQNAAPQQPAAQTPVIPATPAATSPRPATSIPSVAPSASVPAGVPEPVISPVAAGSCGAAWPKVNFQNGMLAVDAPGCSLAEVLNAIQRASGIQFVMAEGSVGAPGVLLPVTVNLGPAPAKMVIQGLFRDVPFDYLMVGPAEAPQTVRFWRIPPQVSFHRGLLSVEAADSSLSEVLYAIQQETGIRFQGA